MTWGEPTLVRGDAAFPQYFLDGERIAFVVPTTSTGFQGRLIAVAQTDGSRLLGGDPEGSFAPKPLGRGRTYKGNDEGI